MLCFNQTVGFPLFAPVLSWLFTAQGMPENVPLSGDSRRDPSALEADSGVGAPGSGSPRGQGESLLGYRARAPLVPSKLY